MRVTKLPYPNLPLLLSIIITILLFSGCATTSSKKSVVTQEEIDTITTQTQTAQVTQVDPEVQRESYPELENVASEDMPQPTAEEIDKNGVIFGKTDFLGVLKTSYVQLTFENVEDPELKFQLHIGDQNSQQVKFPWEVKSVKPGYFFIELPEGKYKITTISIPVGTTMATEPIDIDLEVVPESVAYVGTLRAIGTKEKIKLGGVPVIKPGFEYKANVLDEIQEAEITFRQTYPNITNDILKNIMTLNSL